MQHNDLLRFQRSVGPNDSRTFGGKLTRPRQRLKSAISEVLHFGFRFTRHNQLGKKVEHAEEANTDSHPGRILQHRPD